VQRELEAAERRRNEGATTTLQSPPPPRASSGREVRQVQAGKFTVTVDRDRRTSSPPRAASAQQTQQHAPRSPRRVIRANPNARNADATVAPVSTAQRQPAAAAPAAVAPVAPDPAVVAAVYEGVDTITDEDRAKVAAADPNNNDEPVWFDDD
jgi:hypothetical protein